MPLAVVRLYRNSFAGLHYNSWLLAFVQLVNRAGTMVVPFMSMYMTQKIGVSITKAGFVMACFGMGSIIGSYIGGKLTDRYGFYRLMVVTLFFGGLCFIALSFLVDYWMICLGTFLMSIVNEAFRPASMAAISAYSNPESLTRSGSLVRLSVNLGWAFGAALGGWLASHNYHLLFWVDGTTNILASLLVFYTLPKPKELPAKRHEETPALATISPFKDLFFMGFIVLNCFFGICFFQIFTTFPIFLKTNLQLQEAQIGWVMAMNGLLIAAFEMVLVYSLEHQNKLKLISIGTFVTGLSFLIFNLFQFDGFSMAMLSSVIITIGEILAMPFMLSFTMKRSRPSTIGQYASLYTMAYSIAHIAGSYSGSAIADHFGFDVLWWVIGGISALISLSYFAMHKIESRYPVERYA